MANDMHQTWHYGLVTCWWAEFNTDGPEIAYVQQQIERFGQPALDLACGTGRVLFPLMAAGLDVDGADLSPDMLAWARRRAAGEGRTSALYNQAMHTLDLPRTYGTIMICGAFGLVGSRTRDREALRRIRAHLKPGGALVFDHYLPYVHPRSWSFWLKGGRAELPAAWPGRGSRNQAADGTDLEIRTRLAELDPLAQRTVSEIRVLHWRDADLLAEEQYRLALNMYVVPELQLMLETAGFRDVAVNAADTDEPVTADHAAIVVVARA